MAKFAVIGLGKFGLTVAKKLYQEGAEVIAIDTNEELIEEIKNYVTAAIHMNSTNEEALKMNRIQDVDSVVLSIGNNIEESVLTAAILKKLGISNIHAKVDSNIHGRILELIGIKKIIFPEEERGIQLAHSLLSHSVHEFINLSSGHSILELTAPSEWIGSTLQELALPTKKKINVIAIKSDKLLVTEDGENKIEKQVNDMPGANDVIKEGDILVLIGSKTNIEELIEETSHKE